MPVHTLRIHTFFVVAGALLLGAVTFAQSITFDFDSTANFRHFRRYAWVRGTVLPDAFNHARVVKAVSTQLAAKGLVDVGTGGNPDLLVAYHATFDRDLQISGFAAGWGPYRFGGNRAGVVRTEEILTGTLAVDLVDAATRTIVWRGLAVKEIDVKAEPRERERNIQRAAERLLRNYPPSR